MKKQRAMILGSFVAIVVGTILACRATSKLDTLEDDVGPIDVVKAYLPSIILIGGAFTIIFKAETISEAEIASITSGYAFSQYLNSRYEAEAKKILGTKAEEFREQAYGAVVEDMDSKSAVVVATDHGDNLFYDPISKRLFSCSIEAVRRGELLISSKLQNAPFVSLNRFYESIGLSAVKDYEDLVFEEEPAIGYATFVTADGKPCTVLIYKVVPKWVSLSRKNGYPSNGTIDN